MDYIMMTNTAAQLILAGLLATASALASAEISSLTSEELTDTYIKDTTVIVQQEKAEESEAESIPVTLTVTPLEKGAQVLPDDPTHRVSSINNELDSFTDLSNQVAIDQALLQPAPDATTKFLRPPIDEATLNAVRAAYGLESGEPVDLANLEFLPALTPAQPGDLPANTGYATTPSSFTIRIPNTGNHNSQQISSPNGEVSVNVNSQFIEYTLNIPQ